MQQDKPLVHRPGPITWSRARLRTKTGCLTCRSRRKKCSERKPECHGCSKLSIPCVWPKAIPEENISVPETHGRISRSTITSWSSEKPTSLKPILPAGINRLYYKPTPSDDEHVLSTYFNEKFTPLIVQANAHPRYRLGSLNQLSGLRRVKCVNELVLAIAAQHLAHMQSRFNRLSTEYYISAISNFRGMVDKREVEGSEDWMLQMVMFCCVFERWRVDPISNMSTHILGAIRVFQLHMQKVGKAPGRKVPPFERMITEALLYNTAIVSLHVDLDDNMLSEFFENADYICQSQPFSDATPWANSPVLGGIGPGLYRAICKLSQLCRRAPLRSEELDSVRAVEKELRAAEINIERVLALALQYKDSRGSNSLLSTKLYAAAANIMLYKLQHPEIQASNDRIQGKVSEAIGIIKSMSPPYSPSQFICWPVYITGCAAVRHSDIVFIRQTLQILWDATCCGDIMRAARALEASWAAEGKTYSSLDMLLHKRSALYI